MAPRTLDVAVRPSATGSDGRPAGLARDAARQRPANDRNVPGAPGAGPRLTASIGVIGKHRIDLAAPAGAEIFEQILGRRAAGAGYGEQRVEQVGLVLT